ncbi:RagB/SusD family nutrient uptake outer membrane protein [Pinibacter soli]|uniref:RagB/SusD family nutrient uptake outer membrane protein n=1 Tax=Pinibacter soli TaxID=3044211 RepID=A0ABT6RHG6_9BACT|nr:RagB/SusD family nutrient uptake outer membrane protein [Pinibacter soli]MDI3322014.1 RagB/SusD family nutrient uptake outer membrane protein [Pinibacter soli]
MKNIRYKNYFATLILAVAALSSCKKSFLDMPPEDAVVDANFYKTDDQVKAATSLLYSEVWFDYNDKAMYNLGDFRGGSAFSAWNDRGNVMFNTTGDNGENGASWRAFFNVVAQSNMAIYNINKYAGPEVTASTKKISIAEARFMRSLAYRYLVMNWGAVPIITNNVEQLFDTSIARNTVSSVWRFITSEMRAAAADLPEAAAQQGRLTKWSAEGMLARFYLTRAGVESSGGTRKQQFLDSAKYYANDVITRSGYKLLDSYEQLFKYPYNNNTESLFELQWVFSGTSAWGTANSMPEYLAYSPDISFGGWGGDKGATWWMLSQYDGFVAQGTDTLKGRTVDQRLHATFMLPGFYYPEITKVTDKTKLIFPFSGTDNNFLSVKKYVIGSPLDLAGIASQQHYPNDTYMMRLAEMYLIYTEATIGNAASTSDATAVAYFNAVHQRAGLPAYEVGGQNGSGPLTLDKVFSERFKEFAMEGMAWYDFVSLHYWNPQKAYNMLNAQDRGLFFAKPDQMPNPTLWTFNKTSWFTERKVVANDGNFLLPIPNTELSKAPNLSKPPVDYKL